MVRPIPKGFDDNVNSNGENGAFNRNWLAVAFVSPSFISMHSMAVRFFTPLAINLSSWVR